MISDNGRDTSNYVKCPYCGHPDGTCMKNEYRYGSPIRVCKRCGNKFINPFYHEIVVDGVAPSAFNIKGKLKIAALLAAFFFAAALLHFCEVISGDYYHTALIVIMIASLFGILFAIGDIIFIKSGLKAKRTQKKYNESDARLRNADYAKELAACGYDVPKRYLED